MTSDIANATGTRAVSDHATWNADLDRYEEPNLGIHSYDGDEWLTADDAPADGEEFGASIIMLHGGPRDGAIVS